jgi:hypothetical protein
VNQTQRKYAMERVDAINGRRLKALQEAHPAKRVSCEEKLERIISGRFTINSDTSFRHRYWHDAIETEARRVKDHIMLGGEAEALALITAFAEGLAS